MQNIDERELAKFNALAHQWWEPTGKFKPLHDINPLRLNYINSKAGLQDKRVLDVGCGGGILSESMYHAGAQVVGIDMAEAALSVARIHALETEIIIDYRQISAEALLETEKESFDIVVCMEVLEHVPDPASLVNACMQLVKPGGDIFLATINRNPKAFLLAIVGAEYILNVLPKGTHDYRNLIKPSELAHWVRDAELHIEEIIGMTYNPLTKEFKLGRDIDVNYIMWCKKL